MNSKLRNIRKKLPKIQNCIYLNTGFEGPVPSVMYNKELSPQEIRESLKEAYARVLGCESPNVLITNGTRKAIQLLIQSIEWTCNDEILITNYEHPNIISMLRDYARLNGLRLVIAYLAKEKGWIDTIGALLNQSTKVMILSHVSYCTGEVIPVKELCELSRNWNCITIIDGCQAFAVIEVNVNDLSCDYYILSSHKWSMGPKSSGVMYIRNGMHKPIQYLKSNSHIDEYENDRTQLAVMNWLMHKVGLEWIFNRVRFLTGLAITELKKIPKVKVLIQDQQSGIIGMYIDEIDPVETVNYLMSQSIIVRLIHTEDFCCVRICIAFFNTEDEIKFFIKKLLFFAQSEHDPIHSL